MKLYRVTVRRRSTGMLELQRIYTKASSVHSCAGYWGSRGQWSTSGKMYDVVVETAFVTDWMVLDPKVEKVEQGIASLGNLTYPELERLAARISAQLSTHAEALPA